ncbi:D-sedoheptulose-7-phosphate isomerase [Nitrosococcus wardiae]|uniref:SIS domain-containing protein n=1 Tax=Nitrosococcus wardiae TaxID=1814290 RepID=A0A4P7C079_9GAMM|nr:SIS domain-containing protein [Nitrosococcus wardiae]QBQ55933.1 SIS domain-containing protein [Nitrosococcus wardiae]
MDEDPLHSLYPFLQKGQKAPEEGDSGLLESVRQKAADSLSVKQTFFDAHLHQMVAVAHTLAAVYRGGGRLFTMGNGGSSCDAAHIAVEFQHPVTAGRPALPATHLGADTALMTALGNDVGFKHVFVRQLLAHAKAGDGLIGISTSGNSENLLAAFAKAKELGLATIGLTGMSGGTMAKSPFLDHCLIVPTDSIHRIQECHVAIYHILWDLVHTLLADDRGKSVTYQGNSVL